MAVHMIFTVVIIWMIGYFACILRTKFFKVSIEKILDKIPILKRSIDLKLQ